MNKTVEELRKFFIEQHGIAGTPELEKAISLLAQEIDMFRAEIQELQEKAWKYEQLCK